MVYKYIDYAFGCLVHDAFNHLDMNIVKYLVQSDTISCFCCSPPWYVCIIYAETVLWRGQKCLQNTNNGQSRLIPIYNAFLQRGHRSSLPMLRKTFFLIREENDGGNTD